MSRFLQTSKLCRLPVSCSTTGARRWLNSNPFPGRFADRGETKFAAERGLPGLASKIYASDFSEKSYYLYEYSIVKNLDWFKMLYYTEDL